MVRDAEAQGTGEGVQHEVNYIPTRRVLRTRWGRIYSRVHKCVCRVWARTACNTNDHTKDSLPYDRSAHLTRSSDYGGAAAPSDKRELIAQKTAAPASHTDDDTHSRNLSDRQSAAMCE